MNIKKIAYIHHAGGFGGAPKSMSYIIKYINKEKYKPILVNIANGPINDFFNELAVKIFLPRGIRPFHGSTVTEKTLRTFTVNLVFFVPSVFKAYYLLRHIKPDLIHLNSTCLFSFAIAAKLYNTEIPVICHVREPIRKGLWGFPLRFFSKLCVDGFIAISQNDLESLKLKDGSPHKKEVIYNFVDKMETVSNLKISFREELGIDNNDIIFLYLARFAKSNGWEELINTAKKVVENRSNFHFVLVGADHNYPQYENLKNIHLLNFRTDVVSIFKESNVFICPFTEPHFARGVIEAAAYGLPSIGRDIGGVNELIIDGKTGYLYRSEEEFIKYLNLLGESETARKELGLNGVEFAKENFEMEMNLKRTFKFYSQFFPLKKKQRVK